MPWSFKYPPWWPWFCLRRHLERFTKGQLKEDSYCHQYGGLRSLGGYYMSMIGDYIFAQPNTITGSIGFGVNQLEGLYNKVVNLHTYQRGAFANLFSRHPISLKQNERSTNFLDGFYTVFITKAAGRNLTPDQIPLLHKDEFGLEPALDHKLIDEIGGLNDALSKAANSSVQRITTLRLSSTEISSQEFWKIFKIP